MTDSLFKACANSSQPCIKYSSASVTSGNPVRGPSYYISLGLLPWVNSKAGQTEMRWEKFLDYRGFRLGCAIMSGVHRMMGLQRTNGRADFGGVFTLGLGAIMKTPHQVFIGKSTGKLQRNQKNQILILPMNEHWLCCRSFSLVIILASDLSGTVGWGGLG